MTIIRTKTGLLTLGLALLLPSPPIAYADPPAWAPAHGWRKKHDPYYQGYSGTQWEQDYGIINGQCNFPNHILICCLCSRSNRILDRLGIGTAMANHAYPINS